MKITRHAIDRATSRHGLAGGRAAAALRAAVRDGIRVPASWLRHLGQTAHTARAVREGSRILVHGSTVVVVRSGRVVTTWRLSDDALVDLLVRVAWGFWP